MASKCHVDLIRLKYENEHYFEKSHTDLRNNQYNCNKKYRYHIE